MFTRLKTSSQKITRKVQNTDMIPSKWIYIDNAFLVHCGEQQCRNTRHIKFYQIMIHDNK